MKTWKIAIVGAGYMAGQHAKAFVSLPGVSIVGVCGRSRARAEALAAEYRAPVFETVAAMYRETQADAVVVAVNELSMLDVSLECFRQPWACLLEKPIGIDLAEAWQILAASGAAAARAFVALNRRSYSATRHALEGLAQDDSPRLISVLDQQDLTAVRDSGQPERVVNNYMFANSIHLVDYFCAFGRGEIASVSPAVSWDSRRPRFVVATIRFSSGDVGVYQAVWDGPGPWSVTVTNQSARFELRPLEKLGVQRRGERQLVEVAIDAIDRDFKPGLRHQAEQFVRFLVSGETTLASVGDAARSMALCADIYGLR
ncbi:Gfo/Idh/MocA family oxidoreductase [Bradyrhizobium sp. KBS0727]|nr:Gfo/Idh/MocA family oxidoreductase [Bradyrhizobium sp. KBS0725]QDW48682.1 Gfo/Idh/MocA family oxidoreductase [Bradyrhizobium sp. KBS0727]